MRRMGTITDVDPTSTQGLVLIAVIGAAAGGLIVSLVSAAVRGLAQAFWKGLVSFLRRALRLDDQVTEAPPPLPSTMPDTGRFVGRHEQVRELTRHIRNGNRA